MAPLWPIIWGSVSAIVEVLLGFGSGAIGVATGAITKEVASGLAGFMIKVLFPCLALSFYRDFSAERLEEWAVVPLIAALQIAVAALLGYLTATVCRFPGELKNGFTMVIAFGNNITHPILLTPVVVASWERLAEVGYPAADAQNAARGIVALFLAVWFPILFSVGKPILRTTVGIKMPRVASPKNIMEAIPYVRSWVPFDTITTCILISIGIGCWPWLKNQLLDGYLDFVGRLWGSLGGVGAMCLTFVLGASLYRGRGKWLQLLKVMSGKGKPGKSKVEPEPTIVKPYAEGGAGAVEEPASSSAEAEVEEAKLRSAFKSVDKDGSGRISVQELSKAIKATGLKKTKDEQKAIFAAGDSNGDGQLDWDEFKRVMQAMPELQALAMDAGNALDSVKGDVDPAEMDVILKMTISSSLIRLVIMPAIFIPFTLALSSAGILTKDPVVIFVLCLESCVPSATSPIGLLTSWGKHELAQNLSMIYLPQYIFCAFTMSAVYILSMSIIPVTGEGLPGLAQNATG